LAGIAGYSAGTLDDLMMRATDFVLVLPAIYVALALRSVLPLVLSPTTVFVLLVSIFAVVGSPFIARGVRAIVKTERALDTRPAAQGNRCQSHASAANPSDAGARGSSASRSRC
jgi:ABC-type dipeptide/oligopeptide/nickel transport system permease subunit